jgi:hypothetical protein
VPSCFRERQLGLRTPHAVQPITEGGIASEHVQTAADWALPRCNDTALALVRVINNGPDVVLSVIWLLISKCTWSLTHQG